MSPSGSVSRLIQGLRSGSLAVRDDAARQIWARYFPRLLELARGHLAPRVRRREDEEDVAQSVYKSFCLRLRRGAFELEDRDALWGLLVTLTLRKARNAANRHRRGRRDIRREREDAPADAAGVQQWSLERMEAAGPTPAEAAALAEVLERLLARADPVQRRVIQLKLEGRTNKEIAQELRCVERTVERKLGRIREKLEDLLASDGDA
jgi:RNA polymerase sigma factor (sigma-70 family)